MKITEYERGLRDAARISKLRLLLTATVAYAMIGGVFMGLYACALQLQMYVLSIIAGFLGVFLVAASIKFTDRIFDLWKESYVSNKAR